MLDFDMDHEDFARIKAAGVGGDGNNTVNRMTNSGVKGVGFIAFNTDRQALKNSFAETKIQIDEKTTKGLDVGASLSVGEQSAEGSLDEIREALEGADMVLIITGMGGGIGTGVAPVIAEVAKGMGALTVGVVTRPFTSKGIKRKKQAEAGIKALEDKVSTLVIIPNDRLFQIGSKKTSFAEAFEVADEVLKQGTQGIGDLISVPSMTNPDFADVKTIMYGKGITHVSIGFASGDEGAKEAAKMAIQSPLLETSIEGARSIPLNITGGGDLGILGVAEVADLVRDAVDENANIIFGAGIDGGLGDQVKVTVIATGFDIYNENKASSTNPLDAARNKMKESLENEGDKKSTEELQIPDFLRR